MDFHYFYNETKDTYLDAIWESWTTVPGVVDEPLEYILRSLVTIASVMDTPAPVAQSEAQRLLEISLVRMIKKNPSAEFLHLALIELKDPVTVKWLKFNFSAHFRLARVVRRFLRSSKVQSLLSSNDDENLSVLDEESLDDLSPQEVYDLETCDFDGVVVNNPVAFLRDRLWRCQASESDSYPEEYRAAWVFNVLASAKCELKEST